MTPEQIKADAWQWIRNNRHIDHHDAVKKRGVIANHLTKLCGGKENRQRLTDYLFEFQSLTEAAPIHLAWLYGWLSPVKSNGVWTLAVHPDTAKAIVNADVALVGHGTIEAMYIERTERSYARVVAEFEEGYL